LSEMREPLPQGGGFSHFRVQTHIERHLNGTMRFLSVYDTRQSFGWLRRREAT
jgi:hypothetical protein